MSNFLKGAIKVIMADDHEIFRDGFKLTLSRSDEIEMISDASNGLELIEKVAAFQPDIVVTDIKMPKMDGIQATREIAKKWPRVGVIGLSMFDEDDLIIEMLEAGAKGYLLKNADKTEVIEAIKSVYFEQPYYCRNTSAKLAHMIAKSKYNPFVKNEMPLFTDKETEIIQLICHELTNKEIADKLYLSVRTVEGYRLKILEKMKVKNSIGLVVYAIQHNLFDPDLMQQTDHGH